MTLFISEIYKKYKINFDDISQPFNGTYCNIDFKAEDIVNLMSASYTKGHFIIGAEFNDTSFFEYYPDVGTTTGVCKTIKPMVLSIFKSHIYYFAFYNVGWFSITPKKSKGQG